MGVDFSAGYKYAVALHGGISEYIKASSAYPPFYTVAVFPLSFFPLHTAYRIYFLVLTLALFIMTYVSLTEIDDLDVTSKILSALVITTLFYFSYPVNFALERGNSDLVAGALVISRKDICPSQPPP